MEMMRKEMDCHHPDDEPTDFVDPQTFSCNVTMALQVFIFFMVMHFHSGKSALKSHRPLKISKQLCNRLSRHLMHSDSGNPSTVCFHVQLFDICGLLDSFDSPLLELLISRLTQK